MSLENENQLLLGGKSESQKKLRISYTRDELLALSNLGKELPNGFDISILSELDDASFAINERQRGFGGLASQSTKRSDYGSPPQNRLEGGGGFSRGSSGKWDARSSGSNSRDGDLQSSREAPTQDTSRRFGTQSRHFSQHIEHDGLLGSGAFPRPSGYGGSSTQKSKPSGQYQLNRSSEPYQPPRPYKAIPFQRKDDKDSCNDETFGSTNFSSEDRAEEERKRRTSFELMRKEQQKALLEKQKKVPALLDGLTDNTRIITKTDKADDSQSQSESPRSSTVYAVLSRPLVPPGFASTALDKDLPVQSSSTSLTSEVLLLSTALDKDLPVQSSSTSLTSEASFAGTLASQTPDTTVNDQEKGHQSAVCLDNIILKNDSVSLLVNNEEDFALPQSDDKIYKPVIGVENISAISGLQEVNSVLEDVTKNDAPDHEEERFEVRNSLLQNGSVSILEKLLGGSLLKPASSSATSFVNENLKADEDTWNSSISESSKFANWFLEEENKSAEDFSSKDLLSLIVKNERKSSPAPVVSHGKVIGNMEVSLPFKINDASEKFDRAPTTASVVGIPKQYLQVDKPSPSSAVITCEDLELSILAGMEGNSSLHNAAPGPWACADGKVEQKNSDVDDHASHHLLSLLQKGASKEKEIVSEPSTGFNVGLLEKLSLTDKGSTSNSGIAGNTSSSSEVISSTEKTLTLEALFGAAFMNELQSTQAPVSSQRIQDEGTNTTAVAASVGLPFQASTVNSFSSNSGDYQSSKSINERDFVLSNHIQDINVHQILDPSKEHGNSVIEETKFGSGGLGQKYLEIHLPDEDSLLSASDALHSVTTNNFPFANASKSEETLSKGNLKHFSEKMFDAIPRNEEGIRPSNQDSPPSFQSPHDLVSSGAFYHHLQGRLPPQINHVRPNHPLLDHLTYRNQQMKLIGPDGIHHEPPQNFLENFVPHDTPNHPSAPYIDPAAYHLMLQQMPIPGNLPQQSPLPGLPRGVPLSHQTNHMQGFMPEINNVHNISLHQQHSNYGSFGMGMPAYVGPAAGGNHPETFQMLMEMERRVNAKHVYPAAADHIPRMHGPEFDMSFRYR